jgi:uncharacterized protein (TIGR01777 family)
MKIIIPGGTGFIGTYLTQYFLKKGHSVTVIGTGAHPVAMDHPALDSVFADTCHQGKWQEIFEKADVVINLTGKSIFKRWTKAYKAQIRDSRILTTRHVVAALPSDRPVVLFSASAVGYYGNCGEDSVTERTPPADDFLGQIGKDWEQEAQVAEEKGHRVIRMRFGVVFGKGGGAFQQMTKVFKRFAGGPIGNGRQWFPWIHLLDVACAIDYILNKKDLEGPFNFCSPHLLRNREVARAFGQVLNRPAGLTAPPLMLRLVLGEFAETLLAGQRAVPDRLIKNGFAFRFPRLDNALDNLVS